MVLPIAIVIGSSLVFQHIGIESRGLLLTIFGFLTWHAVLVDAAKIVMANKETERVPHLSHGCDWQCGVKYLIDLVMVVEWIASKEASVYGDLIAVALP